MKVNTVLHFAWSCKEWLVKCHWPPFCNHPFCFNALSLSCPGDFLFSREGVNYSGWCEWFYLMVNGKILESHLSDEKGKMKVWSGWKEAFSILRSNWMSHAACTLFSRNNGLTELCLAMASCQVHKLTGVTFMGCLGVIYSFSGIRDVIVSILFFKCHTFPQLKMFLKCIFWYVYSQSSCHYYC